MSAGSAPREHSKPLAMQQPDLVSMCNELIELANSRGGPDNITCIVARFGGDIPDPDGKEEVGHQVYPLLDTESTTEPVPVYRPDQRKTEATAPSPAITPETAPTGAAEPASRPVAKPP